MTFIARLITLTLVIMLVMASLLGASIKKANYLDRHRVIDKDYGGGAFYDDERIDYELVVCYRYDRAKAFRCRFKVDYPGGDWRISASCYVRVGHSWQCWLVFPYDEETPAGGRYATSFQPPHPKLRKRIVVR